MSNFIRGVFCLSPHPHKDEKVSGLFTTLSKTDFRFYPQSPEAITGQVVIDSEYIPISQLLPAGMSEVDILKQITDWFTLESYLDINLQWELREATYKARFEFTGKHDFRKFLVLTDCVAGIATSQRRGNKQVV